MAKYLPSQARNFVRRSLTAILDPLPSQTELDEIWRYFKSRCAYCGVSIQRSSRRGHIDHLRPADSNEIHNLVLACAICNEKRRDRPWREFLGAVTGSLRSNSTRKARIEVWNLRSAIKWRHSRASDKIISRVMKAFDAAVEELRSLRSHAGR